MFMNCMSCMLWPLEEIHSVQACKPSMPKSETSTNHRMCNELNAPVMKTVQ